MECLNDRTWPYHGMSASRREDQDISVGQVLEDKYF